MQFAIGLLLGGLADHGGSGIVIAVVDGGLNLFEPTFKSILFIFAAGIGDALDFGSDARIPGVSIGESFPFLDGFAVLVLGFEAAGLFHLNIQLTLAGADGRELICEIRILGEAIESFSQNSRLFGEITFGGDALLDFVDVLRGESGLLFGSLGEGGLEKRVGGEFGKGARAGFFDFCRCRMGVKETTNFG